MPTMTRSGSRIFYVDAGTGDPPMVFVHGLGRHEHFRRQLDHFSATHRVVAADLPGFGSSDDSAQQYSIRGYAEDIADMCRELGLHRPVLVGHSMGGGIAVEVAAAQPDLARALVLLDPIPIAAAPMFVERMGGFVSVLDGPGYRDAVRGFAEQLMFRASDDAGVRERLLADMAAAPQHVIASTMASCAHWDGRGAAARVDVPVLLIQTGNGPPTDMAAVTQLVRTLEVGHTVGAGHFAHLLVPEQVNAMIERFLSTLGSEARATTR